MITSLHRYMKWVILYQYLKGNYWFSKQIYDKAIKFYDEALLINPKHSDVMYNKAFALEKINSYHDAIKIYNNVLILDPRNIDALKNKGNCLFEL